MTKTIQEVFSTMDVLRKQHIETERERHFEAQLFRQFEVVDGCMTHKPVRYTAGVNGGVKFGHCGGAKVGQFGASALERAALI
ncbi:hypothetical protein [Marinobacter alexandrii]|uniref:hypothetical protein n=1 Tax=Marinobacter alexandrii TaxID=2570351 RepID=UPI00329698AC